MIARASLVFCFLFAVAGSANAAGKARTRNVAIVLYDGVELLDFAGPGDVFAAAGRIGGSDAPAFHVYTVGRSKAPLTSERFVQIVPEFSIRRAQARPGGVSRRRRAQHRRRPGADGLGRLLGRAAADETARYMEYRWTPEPYLIPMYASSK